MNSATPAGQHGGAATLHAIGAGLAMVLLIGCTAAETVDRLPPPTKADLLPVDSDAAYTEMREQRAAMMNSRYPDVELPTPERVRFVLPAEWPNTMQQCMLEQGFSSTLSDDGGVEYEGIPSDQALAFDIADYSCSLRYPVDPRYLSEFSPYQLEFLYEYYVLDLVPCLEEEGVNVSEPPTFQKFSDTWETEDAWSPYSSVDPGSQANWNRLNNTCPQNPDPDVLFGG